jgi:hypothetical protein
LLRFSQCCFWLAFTTLAHAANDSGYIGSKACFACHETIYRSYLKTGMGRSMQPVSQIDDSAFPHEWTASAATQTRVVRVYRDQAGWHQSETESNVFNEDYKLDYAVGAGENGFTFLFRRGNYLFQAPLSFYSKTGKWDLSPGYEAIDLGFSRTVPEACLACHAGRPQAVPKRIGEYRDPPFAEMAIGCENCHGPGAEHAKATGHAPSAILNPARLPARLAEDICMNCHQRGDTRILQPGKTFVDFHPGQPLFQTLAIFKVADQNSQHTPADLLEHDAAMKASRCFRASEGKLSCLTCHDPHIEPKGLEAVAYYRSKCLTCHTAASCRLTAAVRNEKKPANDCVGCHMPKREVTTISHSALTNHRIPGPASASFEPSLPASSTGLILIDPPPNQQAQVPDITLLRAYSELAPRYRGYQTRYLDLLERLSQTQPREPFVQAALGHKLLPEGKNEEAFAHLSNALVLEEPAVFLDIAKACTNLDRFDDALTYLKNGVELHPYDAVLQKTLIVQYINLKRYADARQAMEKYVICFPDDAFMRGMLARVSN